jgi:hypothetical protein
MTIASDAQFHLRGLVIVAAICMGCASSNQSLSVAIRASRDSVPLVTNTQGVSFSVPAIVRNNEARAVFVTGCGPAAEREIDGKWVVVFSPVCMQGLAVQVSAGDSAVIPVTLYGYSAAGLLPRLDPRAQPGNYRLIFDVSTMDNGSTSPAGSQRIASAPFFITN